MINNQQKRHVVDLFLKTKKENPEFLKSWSEKLLKELLNSKTACLEWITKNKNIVSALIYTGQGLEDGQYSLSEIQLVFTDPEHLKKGYARGLIQKLMAQSKEVWLDVHVDNAGAIGLYQSEGFKEVGRRKSYYFDGSEAILMSYQK